MFFILFTVSLYYQSITFLPVLILLWLKQNSKFNALFLKSLNKNEIFYKTKNIYLVFYYFFLNVLKFKNQFHYKWFPLTKRTSYFTFFFFCKNQNKNIF